MNPKIIDKMYDRARELVLETCHIEEQERIEEGRVRLVNVVVEHTEQYIVDLLIADFNVIMLEARSVVRDVVEDLADEGVDFYEEKTELITKWMPVHERLYREGHLVDASTFDAPKPWNVVIGSGAWKRAYGL